MATANNYQKLRLGLRTVKNMWFGNRPLCVSFEVTHSCNCNCRHCDKGGLKKEVKLMVPEDFKRRLKEFKPPFIQISGGEPLEREGIYDIVRALRGKSVVPFIVFVTNGRLLDEQKYLDLKKAGVNRFSLSLDFPDERHDEFRRNKGLFKHLNGLIPYLANKYKADDIGMNCAITRANFRDLLGIAKLTHSWGVPVTYSAYSKLRTGDEDLFIYDKNELADLKKEIDSLIDYKIKMRPAQTVMNAISTLNSTYEFFENKGTPGCMAGERFLIVRPDGSLNACSMFPDDIYQTREEMLEKFTTRETCQDCYVAIRAYSGKSLPTMFKEMIGL